MSVSIYDIVEELATSYWLDNYCKQFRGNPDDTLYIDDLMQDTYLNLLTNNKDKVIQLYNQGGMAKVQRYVSGMIVRNLHSKTSPFYYTYKKHKHENIDNYEDIEQLQADR